MSTKQNTILLTMIRKVDYNIGKYNIYLFDGPHHFEDHFEGITFVQPALTDKYILMMTGTGTRLEMELLRNRRIKT